MDVIAPRPANSFPTPGTPRHPAYPSGHSTYSAAAAFTLIAFFPQYAEDLLRLADDAEQQQLKEAFLQEHGLAPEPAG